MANLASILKSSDMPALAELLRKHGRGKDTVLAHITPKEAALLKARGGRGSRNPKTGLLEFDDGVDYFAPQTDVGTFSEAQTPGSGSFVPDIQSAPIPESTANAQLQQDYIRQVNSGDAEPGQDVAGMKYWPVTADTLATARNPVTSNSGVSSDGGGAINIATAPSVAANIQRDQTQVGGATGTDAVGKPMDISPAKPAATDWWSKLTSDPLKLALGLGGAGLGLYNQMQARKQAQGVANQVSDLATQQKQMAQPYLTEGATQYGQAVQGRMTPVQQQAFDAARAQIAQQASRTGAVGANQAVAVEERMRQQALNGQLTAGLQLINTGDTIMNQAFANQIQALNQNVALNQQANQASASFFGALGQWFGGSKNA